MAKINIDLETCAHSSPVEIIDCDQIQLADALDQLPTELVKVLWLKLLVRRFLTWIVHLRNGRPTRAFYKVRIARCLNCVGVK